MKHITEYLQEGKGLMAFINESDSAQYVSFTTAGLDGADDFKKSIAALSNKTGVYTETTSDGVKIKIKPGDESKLEGFIDVLNGLAEKNLAKDETKAKAEKLQAQVAKLMDIAEDAALAAEETEAKKKEEGDKKEEE